MANYLTYSKKILSKISFDSQLLNKEYRKAIKLLTAQETHKLNEWIKRQKFAARLRKSSAAFE